MLYLFRRLAFLGVLTLLAVACLLVTKPFTGSIDTTTEEISMVEPSGNAGKDYQYSQTNLNNSEANKNNAEAETTTLLGQAVATKTVAEACESNPYLESCMPPHPADIGPGLAIVLIALVLATLLFAIFAWIMKKMA